MQSDNNASNSPKIDQIYFMAPPNITEDQEFSGQPEELINVPDRVRKTIERGLANLYQEKSQFQLLNQLNTLISNMYQFKVCTLCYGKGHIENQCCLRSKILKMASEQRKGFDRIIASGWKSLKSKEKGKNSKDISIEQNCDTIKFTETRHLIDRSQIPKTL